MALTFEWDPTKDESNQRKHGVSFAEASTVFRDTLSITFPDPDHSVVENRSVTLGMSSRRRLLFVAHTARRGCIRIFSARRPTSRERRQYEELFF